ncbi:hypothetical protein GG344DRAFT_81530 [Lentinula edodes]|nr:hypothetical protein GG344DRAFT_81530 [Lentinula edodes]
MQWTGGRAGGHHSYEDFHQPMLSTYRSIRKHENIILVGGSGFGAAEDVWPYLTGESTLLANLPYWRMPMPYDGFLFGSRVMVAKEAHTSSSVKDLIVACAGVEDQQWEGTYTKPSGGVLTVRSELGEPIHKVATRAVKLWKEFDDTVFKLPKEKRSTWLLEHRDEVIEKLNKHFSKPWFGWKKDGSVAELRDMTYEETVLRMVRLMYVAHENRWVDISLRNFTGDWMRRIEERFAGVNGSGTKPSVLQSYNSLNDPLPCVETFFKAYPLASQQLLSVDDSGYFLAISQRRGQKPVPFIPVLDASFEVWFKKDSLWAAEDVEAVFDQDPERVCILQGPVAVKHSVIKDEPIRDLLGNINSSLIQKVLQLRYNGDASTIPPIGYLAPPRRASRVPAGVKITTTDEQIVYQFGISLPTNASWLACLAGSQLNWFGALIGSTSVVQGSSYISNPIRRLFYPRPHEKVVVSLSNGQPTSIVAYGGARSYGLHDPNFKATEIIFNCSTNLIDATIFEERNKVAVPLTLQFEYKSAMGSAPIHEVVTGRNMRIKAFYWKLWYGDDQSLPELDIHDTFTGPDVTLKAEDIKKFCSVVGNNDKSFKSVRTTTISAPMDFAIVAGWQAIIKSIFPASIDGDLLKLVHLSNSFRMMKGARPFQAGDICRSEAKIVSVVNSGPGKVVKVKGHVYRDAKPVVEVVSAFLYRGVFTDYENTFETTEEPDYIVTLATDADVSVLQSKEWFDWEDDTRPLSPGIPLIFRVQSEVSSMDRTSYRELSVSGEIFVRDQLKNLQKVGSVEFQADDAHGNPVVAYLQRHGIAQGLSVPLANEGYQLTTTEGSTSFFSPLTNEPYSGISGDFNPIHINPYFSCYAGLPGTITHGLWSSAATRKYVENVVAKGHPDRVLSYDVSFVGMVLPGEQLTVNLRHTGMRDGNIVVKIETVNVLGEKVLEGSAEVSQPTTAYVFTGQGSQEPNMGMDLYNSSPAARAVWDGADEHLRAVYGFSILEIVKENPKEKTVHSGGIKGQAIRQRYMDVSYDTTDKDGHIKTLPLFADIDIRTPKYTFSYPNGLLFATQFAQIALVVTKKAAFADMRSKGFVQTDCAFAGHSLGEYSALASIADVLAISALVDVTSSPRLDKVLKNWDEENWDSAAQRQNLTYIILVELLAYQFASPVRWIQTQDLLFSHFNFERLIELGPSPTLTGMATRTLKAKYELQDDCVSLKREILCHAKHSKEIYYLFEDEAVAESVPVEVTESVAAPVTATVTAATAVPLPVAVPTGPAVSIEDVPVKSSDILLAIVAQKSKKQISDISTSKSIKDLVGGKSTLQNEILGDLQQEFSSAPEKGEELPLDELGPALGSGHSGTLGKYTTGLVSRLVGGKLPGGFNSSAVKAHLSKTWGLGPQRADGVLLLGTTMEPAKRLGSEAEAKTWLDGVVSAYAQRSGISLASPGAGGGGGGGGSGGAVINREEFTKFQAEQERFAAQHIELYMRPQKSGIATVSADKVPLLHLKRKVGTNWEYSSNLTSVYLDIFHQIATAGTTFKDKNALLTGVGKGSIGVEVVVYSLVAFMCRGSALTVVPFRFEAGRRGPCGLHLLYSTLGIDLDFILPFAGIPKNGREIDGIDDKSELAHRIMLTNLLRILGAVKNKKASRHFVTCPTQVILPLSPNHGLFGNDGLYSESKISLETLFQRWASEGRGEYLCLAGAVIGWTRGTTFMGPTNIVAHELESFDVRTFSAKEMAFNILGLMHPLLFSITQVEPIWADLNGGMDRHPDLADITTPPVLGRC